MKQIYFIFGTWYLCSIHVRLKMVMGTPWWGPRSRTRTSHGFHIFTLSGLVQKFWTTFFSNENVGSTSCFQSTYKACLKIRLGGMRDQGRHRSALALATSDLRLHLLLHPTVHRLPTEQARLKKGFKFYCNKKELNRLLTWLPSW